MELQEWEAVLAAPHIKQRFVPLQSTVTTNHLFLLAGFEVWGYFNPTEDGTTASWTLAVHKLFLAAFWVLTASASPLFHVLSARKLFVFSLLH
jgi:hypothetical protein